MRERWQQIWLGCSEVSGSASRGETFFDPYLSEPGGCNWTEGELKGLQKYIGSGGFIIFDDIEGDPNPNYRNLVFQWRRAFPNEAYKLWVNYFLYALTH